MLTCGEGVSPLGGEPAVLPLSPCALPAQGGGLHLGGSDTHLGLGKGAGEGTGRMLIWLKPVWLRG